MIRCTLDLLPGGQTSGKERLGVIYISNDVLHTLTTEGKRGSYVYEIYKKRRTKAFKKGKIKNFPRLSYHPWNLVRDILNEVAKQNGGRI